MRHKIPILACLMLLGACSNNVSNNLACNNYRSQIEAKNQLEDEGFNKKGAARLIKTEVMDIFFSPKTESCVYLIKQESSWANSHFSDLYILYNYFDNSILESAEGGDDYTQSWMEASAKIKATIEDYK